MSSLRYGQEHLLQISLLFYHCCCRSNASHVNGISIIGADDAALAIKPFAGEFAGVLFGIGLLTASYMGAVIIPLTTAYAFSEFFGTEGSLDLPFHKKAVCFMAFSHSDCNSFFAIMIPGVSFPNCFIHTRSQWYFASCIIYFY